MAGVLKYALSLSTSSFTGPMKAATGVVSGFADAAGSATGKVAGLAGKIAAVAGPLAAAGAAFKAAVKAADFESMEAGFATILGSGEAAKAMLKDIAAEAASTPYGINDLAQSARSLLAVTKREDITPTLRMIGDLASAAQKPVTELAAMYAKIKGSDSVQGEDLNQLSDALPGSLQEFVKVLNVDSVKAVRKLGEEGRISGAALDQVFINLTSKGGMAFAAMDSQSRTTNGLMSTLKDGFDALLVTLGTPLNDFLKPIIEQNITRLDRLNTQATAFFQLLKGAGKNGNLGEFIGASLKLKFIDGVNTLSGGLRGIVAYLGSALPVIFNAAVDELTSDRTKIFFTSLFSGIGEILKSKMEAASATFFSGIGRKGLAAELTQSSASSQTRGENYLTTASAALATADLGGVIDNVAGALKAADEAGRAAFASANATPLIDRGPALEDFKKQGEKANASALKTFLDPKGKETASAPPKPLKSGFNGLAPAAKTASELAKAENQLAAAAAFALEGKILDAKANKQSKLVETLERQAKVEALKLELMEKQGLAEKDAAAAAEKRIALEERAANPRRRGLLDSAASAASRQSRRSAADVARDTRLGRTGENQADRLAQVDKDRRGSRPLSPAAAAERLARGGAAADPGKTRREERAEAKQNAADPLLAAVREIKTQFETLATA